MKLDPFLEPDPRADLLGDLTSDEKTDQNILESWDLFSEPPDSGEQAPSEPESIDTPGEWEYITPGPEVAESVWARFDQAFRTLESPNDRSALVRLQMHLAG